MPLHPSMLVTFGSITTTQTKVLRLTYRVLMIAFVLFVITAALPLNLRSQVWGHQFSSAILNVCVLPWLALALGFLGVTLQQREQLQARLAAGDARPAASLVRADRGGSEEDNDKPDRPPLAKDGDLRFMAMLGFYGMVLLAVWQLVLFAGSLGQIDARQVGESQVIDQRFGVLQQQLKQLPPERLDQAFQRLGLPPAPAGQSDDPFERLQDRRTQVKQETNRKAGQARFLLTRESLRNLLLAVLYATGFYGLARS
ncbi:MAG: hypothetical protein KFB97_09080 [Cyanobium sp. M30B3]|nr:MAG: hypothetical protein KFB97_09080 [Cyanobium sp. M30B3]